MTYDLSLGVVKFTKGVEEIAYKRPHKIEQYDSLSDREKENMKTVYFRNEEDKRKGVEYVMSKILGFYKECLELGPEYRTRLKESGSNGNQGGFRREEKSLIYNTSFLGEYECSSLALDRRRKKIEDEI
ncbi:hypothetical protein Tco_0052190 [Tanacetum coccineum]